MLAKRSCSIKPLILPEVSSRMASWTSGVRGGGSLASTASAGAARKLKFYKQGTARVLVEVVDLEG